MCRPCVLYAVWQRSEITRLGALELQLQLVCNQRDKLTIRGFSLGIGYGVAEKSLECIQVTAVPGYFDGVADGSFHTAGGGLEGLDESWILCVDK